MLQRFAEVGRALTQFPQQSSILDRDDGLACKVLEQVDLLVAEWPHLKAVHDEGADNLAFLEQRHEQRGAQSSFDRRYLRGNAPQV